jgi:hypothetical protein
MPAADRIEGDRPAAPRVDNQSVFKERFWRDKADSNIFHDKIAASRRRHSPLK